MILDQKPCVVCHVDHFNRFLVGTYELFTSLENARAKLSSEIDDRSLQENLNQINQRAGKLILIDHSLDEPRIDYEYDCLQGGGVFDARVCFDPSKPNAAAIYVAHSNGLIGIYELTQIEERLIISTKQHIKVSEPSTLLTSIDSIYESKPQPDESSKTLVVGDSKGVLSVIDDSDVVAQAPLGQDESIWQVRVFKTTQESCIIIVGAENCSWYIYHLDRAARKLSLLYKNQYNDFGAGVTSICCLSRSLDQGCCSFEILLGSYDESIQAYKITLDTKTVRVCHKGKRSINGGGIWRIKLTRSTQRDSADRLLISAMYAGSFALELPADCEISAVTNSAKLFKLLEVEKLGLPVQPLHYDIAVANMNLARDSLMCIADFNNSLCLLMPINQSKVKSLSATEQE